jgi:lipoyl(octanoyl) transferase
VAQSEWPVDALSFVVISGSTTSSAIDLRVRDLSRMAYAEAFDLQKRLQREVIESRGTDGEPSGLVHLLLVEHDPPVITVSRRPGARQHLIATPAQLEAAGVEVAETDRGGDITYHGPGQLVVYPILDLNCLGLRIDSYMRFLEQVVIDVLAQFGIQGERDRAATGVWVKSRADAHGLQSVGVTGSSAPPAKICALGVRVSRWVSMHGIALNCNNDLEPFSLIIPCGIKGYEVTSLSRETGHDVGIADAMPHVVSSFSDVFGLTFTPATLEEVLGQRA